MQKVDKNKSIKINGYKELKNELYLKELKNVITFNCGDSSWERNLFDSDLIFKEDTPLISKQIYIFNSFTKILFFREYLGRNFNRAKSSGSRHWRIYLSIFTNLKHGKL